MVNLWKSDHVTAIYEYDNDEINVLADRVSINRQMVRACGCVVCVCVCVSVWCVYSVASSTSWCLRCTASSCFPVYTALQVASDVVHLYQFVAVVYRQCVVMFTLCCRAI